MSEPIPSTNRTWWYVAIGFAAFWMLYLAYFAPGRRAGRPLLEGSAMTQPATYDWSLVDLDDSPVTFAKFRGKTLFLNIWATWCGPCVGEMPSIASLASLPCWKDKNIAFVCVSIDDSTEVVRRFVQGKNWSMTFLRAGNLPPVFSTEGIPATFVISADGHIAASEVGAADWTDPGVVAFLDKLSGASSPAIDERTGRFIAAPGLISTQGNAQALFV